VDVTSTEVSLIELLVSEESLKEVDMASAADVTSVVVDTMLVFVADAI